MTAAKKNGVLTRRNLCGSGLYGAALMLTGCGGGGGGGDAAPAANSGGSGPVNGGLTGTVSYSFAGKTFKFDVATGNESEIKFRDETDASTSAFVINTRYFDISPNGKTLFFIDDLGAGRLAAVDIESKLTKTVFKIAQAGDWTEIRLSPDGQKFAMVKDGINGGNGVYIIDSSGKTITSYAVNSGAANSVAWTPDNRLLYSNGGIYLTNPGDLKNALRINTSGAQSVAISPAGDKIAYSSQRHIWTMGIKGDNVQQVTVGDNAEFQARWSPDGRHIILQSELYGTNAPGGLATTGNIYYLVVIPADGKQYTLTRAAITGSGGGTVTGFVAGAGVIELKAKTTRGSDRLYDVPAYDMNWR
jgi:hypothetical protein